MSEPEFERERVTTEEAPVLETVPRPQRESVGAVEAQPISVVTIEAPPSGEQLIPEIVKPDSWSKILLKPRVDSFNQGELLGELKEIVDSGAIRVALDLRQNRFVSVAVIKACVETARKLADAGGELALVGCPERTKRHFEVFGTLDEIRIARTEEQLESGARRPRSTKASAPEAS
ncbi:MAG: STAS domain-containing protein [Bdellovibrionota bacterium]